MDDAKKGARETKRDRKKGEIDREKVRESDREKRRGVEGEKR